MIIATSCPQFSSSTCLHKTTGLSFVAIAVSIDCWENGLGKDVVEKYIREGALNWPPQGFRKFAFVVVGC